MSRCRRRAEQGREERTSGVGLAGVGFRPTCFLSRNLSAARLSGKVHAWVKWRHTVRVAVELARCHLFRDVGRGGETGETGGDGGQGG